MIAYSVRSANPFITSFNPHNSEKFCEPFGHRDQRGERSERT